MARKPVFTQDGAKSALAAFKLIEADEARTDHWEEVFTFLKAAVRLLPSDKPRGKRKGA